MNIKDYEIFKFSENKYTDFINNGVKYSLNKEPYLDVVLTDFCNANCNFCIADLIHEKLICDVEKFKRKILYAIEHMNVREVLLLGGEPTASRDLIPMIEWLSTLKLDKIVMTTNGIRLAKDPKYCEEVMKAGLTNLNISFMNLDPSKQRQITNAKVDMVLMDIAAIYGVAKKYNVNMRINNNVFLNNNDTLEDIIEFYNTVRPFCDSVKFSPLLKTDAFSVIDFKTEWARENVLPDDKILALFESIHEYFQRVYDVSIIENDLQFGFVKNTMIPLRKPIILNWNFGEFTGMMARVVKYQQINGVKLLPNNELSLSWNRELPQYFIKTE